MNALNDSRPFRLVFMGTPDFAAPCLRHLIEQGQEIAAVYSQPPRPSGRGYKLTPSPVHQLAEQHDIPVYTPTSLKPSDVQAEFASHRADAAIVAAYGLILPQAILDAYPMGCLNVHPSRLPRWRGAAPLQRTIMAGDSETAMTIMQMDAGLDTGDVLSEQPVAIPAGLTTGELHDHMAMLAGPAILAALRGLRTGTTSPRKQSENGVTYAQKISKDEARIDWTQSADAVLHHIHGLSPYPGAYFEYQGEKIKLLKAAATSVSGAAGTLLDDQLTLACGSGAIRPLLLQRAGKKPMPLDEFLRGFTIPKGTTL